MDLLFPGCVRCAWLVTRTGRGKASPATAAGSKRSGRRAVDARRSLTRRLAALRRYRASVARRLR
jgi:hypothetical protein